MFQLSVFIFIIFQENWTQKSIARSNFDMKTEFWIQFSGKLLTPEALHSKPREDINLVIFANAVF